MSTRNKHSRRKLERKVEQLTKRNAELYEVLQMAEDAGVEEGLFCEDERMTIPSSATGEE